MITLFIGGIADGTWMDIDPTVDFVDVPDIINISDLSLHDPNAMPKCETYDVFRYTEQKLASPTRKYRVMALLEDGECVIDKLIKGYKL